MALFKSGGVLPKTLAAVALWAGASAAASAGNLVTNGGFESTAFTQSTLFSGTATPATGWTSQGTFVLLCETSGTCDDESVVINGFALAGPKNGNNNGLTTSPNGGNYMAFDSDPSFHGDFSQTINGLTPGSKYTLSFYMAGAQEIDAGGPTTTSITASLGTDSYTTPTISTPSQGFSPWQLYSTTFTASSASEVLNFLATGGPGGEPPYALLDGVSLTGVTGGVPEPGAWALMLLGICGVGGALRLRRRAVPTAA